MQIPDLTQKHDYYSYWIPVESGKTSPDEWQAALMDSVEEALSEGVFYTKDMMAWVKNHADFVPSDWWDIPFSGAPVEGGKMGMEVYSARKAVENKKEREENKKALENINLDDVLGSLCINGKRVNKCFVEWIDNESGMVTLYGITGRYPCKVRTQAKNIAHMVSSAIDRGWRKA